MPATTNWRNYHVSVDTIESRSGPASEDSFVFAGDGSVMSADAQGIIAVLIGLVEDDAPYDPGFLGGVVVAAGDVVVVDGRIITAEDYF